MGGNSRALDDLGSIKQWKGQPAFAEKIDLAKIPRNQFVAEIRILVESINDYYEQTFGSPIWAKKVMDGTTIYNGSTLSFMDEAISDREFLQVKPKIGDLDITVPKQCRNNLWSLLKDFEGTMLTEHIIYVGSNKPTETSVGEQINSVLEFTPTGDLFQIDWEFVDYAYGYPKAWSKFSKSADWQDMQAGIKGVFHKYLLRAITRCKDPIENISVLTPSSPTASAIELSSLQTKLSVEKDPSRIKLLEAELKRSTPKLSKPFLDKPMINRYSFSILYGIRDKVEMLVNEEGEELLVVHPSGDIRRAVKFRAVEESDYVSEPDEIYEVLFGPLPDMYLGKLPKETAKQFGSFLGLIELLKQSDHPTKLIVDQFIDLLWGINMDRITPKSKPEDLTNAGQALERELWQVDRDVKTIALTALINGLGFDPNDYNIDRMHSLYYGVDGEAYLRLRTGPNRETNE